MSHHPSPIPPHPRPSPLTRLRRSSLRLQLVVGIGLCALLIALVFGAVANQLVRKEIEKDRGALLRQTAGRMAAQLAQDMSGRAEELQLLASLAPLRDPKTTAGSQQDLLLRVQKAYPSYAWIGLANAGGDIVASTEPGLNGGNVAARDWFLKGGQGLHFGEAHEATLMSRFLPPPKTDLPQRLVDIATPVYSDKGVWLGVLAAHLSLDWAFDVRERLLDQLQDEALDLVVLSSGGQLLLGAPGLVASDSELMALRQRALAAPAGDGVPTLQWPDGRRYLSVAVADTGFHRYPGLGWTVLVRLPEDRAFAAAEQLARLIWLSGVLSAALFALLLWLIVGRQLRPLERLSAAAQAMRQGGTSAHLPEPQGDGEVAVFARSLTGLVNALGESQARFRHLFDAAPVAMAHIGHDGRVQARNSRFDSLLGYSHAELATLADWWRLCFDDPAYRDRVRGLWKEAMKGATGGRGDIGSGEYRIRRRDGAERLLQISGILLDDGMLCSFHDLTTLRHTEARLRLWAESFEQAELGLMLADARNNTVLAVNPAYARERSYSRAAMVGLPLHQLFPPERRGDIDAIIQTLAHSSHGLFESEHLGADGRRFPVLLDITVLRDEAGQPLHRITYALDLTERLRAEHEVQRLNADLEQRVQQRTAELSAANRELDSFAYTVSHDLRSPLRSMNGFAQLLLDEHGASLNAEAHLYVQRIQQASLKMGSLIEGILTLSRSARGALQNDSVDLSELALRRLAELAQRDPGRSVAVEVEPGLHIQGDARMIDALMGNLLENAWKYTGKTPHAVIRVHRGGLLGLSGFCVSDNGSGFDMARAGDLFLPFLRLHRQDEFAGTGVGLATVQRIVERHGGRIVAEAAPGRGACFCFTLAAPG